ncbi:MAG TPA: D-aminoacyl-tRNA deacylase [Spirochaetota bacterium]|nr:D-aminoacyl-tRNA deacylase [Spirochaetota bacterium]
MRVVIQRVKKSSVTVENRVVSEISRGFLVLLGISANDKEDDTNYIIDKIINLRIFTDDNDKFNLSLQDVFGELLIVSQFTLYGDARKGRRPSFDLAAKGDLALPIYEDFLQKLKSKYNPEKIKTGIFAAMMDVSLVNDGPVTILLDSEKKF